jgi:hypothetical protein
MVYKDKIKNSRFLDSYRQFGYNSILLETIENSEFSGAILPTDSAYYIIASSQKDWRILSQLVKSFVGLSFSDFIGMQSTLSFQSKVEKFLLSQSIPFIAKVSTKSNSIEAKQAFCNLYRLHKASSNKNIILPKHLSSILDEFKERLRYQDIDSAKNIINRLKRESRIDVLNLKFMEIELAYTVKDWEAIAYKPELIQIVNSRKPLRIRLHIIEALFYIYLYKNATIYIYNQKIKPILLTLLMDIPSNVEDSIKTIYFLAYLNGDVDKNKIKKIIQTIQSNNYLSSELKVEIVKKYRVSKPFEAKNFQNDYLLARATIINANNSDTLKSIVEVKKQLKRVEINKRLNQKSIHSDIIKTDTLPQNWKEWIEQLSTKSFREASSIAEYGLEEWSIDRTLNDPLDIEELSQTILEVEEEFARNRFISSMPLFIESLKRVQNSTNPLFKPIYIAILEFITIFEVQDQNTLISSQNLVESLLITAPNQEQYKIILEMLESIVERTNGKDLVNWLLDYAELLLSYNTPNEKLRENTMQTLLQKVYTHKEWLEEYQIDLLLKLSSSIGIVKLFDSLQEQKNEEVDDKWAKYTNKTIGIYTLSENAGREAKRRLEKYIRNVKVLLNHDKASTTALKNLAQTSDYVVLVTQSAKHATSGAIQKILRLRNKEPLFPIGKGSSSIIASLI